jgi:hypothetical protein
MFRALRLMCKKLRDFLKAPQEATMNESIYVALEDPFVENQDTPVEAQHERTTPSDH